MIVVLTSRVANSSYGHGSKPMVSHFWDRCTTHFRTYFSGWIESDAHWGLTDLGFDPILHILWFLINPR